MSVQLTPARTAPKCRGLLALCGLVVLGLPAVANALVVETTLDRLLGENNPGITIGDKRYYNFTFSESTPGTPDVNPEDVNVRISNTGNPQQYTLQFTFGLDAMPGERRQDMVICYDLDVLSTDVINRIGLRFNGLVFQGTGPAQTAVVETVTTRDGPDLTLETPEVRNTEVLGVSNDGPGRLPDSNSDFMDVIPTRRLTFCKDIIVSSDDNGGYAVISVVDNIVFQIPEPGTLGLVSLAGAALMLRRRRP